MPSASIEIGGSDAGNWMVHTPKLWVVVVLVWPLYELVVYQYSKAAKSRSRYRPVITLRALARRRPRRNGGPGEQVSVIESSRSFHRQPWRPASSRSAV